MAQLTIEIDHRTWICNELSFYCELYKRYFVITYWWLRNSVLILYECKFVIDFKYFDWPIHTFIYWNPWHHLTNIIRATNHFYSNLIHIKSWHGYMRSKTGFTLSMTMMGWLELSTVHTIYHSFQLSPGSTVAMISTPWPKSQPWQSAQGELHLCYWRK